MRELKADYMVKMIHGFNLVAEKAAAQVSLGSEVGGLGAGFVSKRS